MSGSPRLLFVDDDVAVQRAFTRSLNGFNVSIECVNGVVAAVAALQSKSYDILVTDMTMPDGTGIDVLNAAVQHAPHVVRLVISGDPDLAATLADSVVDFILEKPWNVVDLRTQIQSAIEIAASRSPVP